MPSLFGGRHRLVCVIHQQERVLNQGLTITLQVHEGNVEGRYSIEGEAQMHGFSFVVRMTPFLQLKLLPNDVSTPDVCFLFLS